MFSFVPPALAYYVHDLDPFLVRFGGQFGIRWYGLAYLSAFLIAYLLCKFFAKKGYLDLKPEAVGDFITGCAIFGVLIGGRLGYMLFYNFDGLIHEPLSIVRVWDGGMSAHGGIIGVTAYAIWYSRRHRLSFFNLGDNLVVSVPIGLFLGRLANFINGELYGRVAQVSWAMQFPKEIYDDGDKSQRAIQAAMAIDPSWNTPDLVIENVRHSESLRAQLAEILSPRYPSQLFEAATEGLLLFLVLWILRTRFRLPNGILCGVFFVGYAILRSAMEVFREPDSPLVGALTRGQFLSLFMFIVAAIFFTLALRNPRYPRKFSA